MVEVGVPGAEMTRNSSALRFKGLLNIAKVIPMLVWEVYRFDGRKIRKAVRRPEIKEKPSMEQDCSVTADV
jgi:hypothetical protein